MVYRLARPERKSKGWFLGYVVVRQGLVMLIIYALLWLLIPLDWDILAAAFLVTLVLVTCQNRVLIRRHERRFEMLGTQFVTLTEAGSIYAVSTGSVLTQYLSWQNAVCTMVFTLFHWPCATTLMTVYRETGSKKTTVAAFLLPTTVGCSICFLLNWLL